MPSKKAVKSESIVSPLSDLSPAKAPRKRTTAKSSVAAPATMEKPARAAATRKKAAVAADTPVAAVTHRHKKQESITQFDDAAVAVAAPTPAPAYEPSYDEVAKLAYSYYVARGYQSGDQASDWFRAIQELKQRHAASLLLLDPKP
jgi:hypothetical protein